MPKKMLFGLMAIVLTPILMLAVYCSYCLDQDSLRVQDAIPAFRPIEQLKPQFFSQPYGARYCRYVIDFPPNSLLTDENVSILESLNRLPGRNILELTVRTRRITDASIPILATLKSVDYLVLDETGMTNKGIAQLQGLLSKEIVPARYNPGLNHHDLTTSTSQ